VWRVPKAHACIAQARLPQRERITIMKCQDCREHIVDALYGELDTERTASFHEALERCPDCRQAWNEALATFRAFDNLAEVEVPGKMRGEILRAARLELAARQETGWRGFAALFRTPSFVVAASALAAVVLVGAWMWAGGRGTESATSDDAAVMAAADVPREGAAPADDYIGRSESPRQIVSESAEATSHEHSEGGVEEPLVQPAYDRANDDSAAYESADDEFEPEAAPGLAAESPRRQAAPPREIAVALSPERDRAAAPDEPAVEQSSPVGAGIAARERTQETSGRRSGGDSVGEPDARDVHRGRASAEEQVQRPEQGAPRAERMREDAAVASRDRSPARATNDQVVQSQPAAPPSPEPAAAAAPATTTRATGVSQPAPAVRPESDDADSEAMAGAGPSSYDAPYEAEESDIDALAGDGMVMAEASTERPEARDQSRGTSASPLDQGLGHFDAREYAQAATALEAALRQDLRASHEREALYALGVSYMRLGRTSDARRTLRVLVDQHRSSREGRLAAEILEGMEDERPADTPMRRESLDENRR